MLHAAAKPFNACWRPHLEEASKTKSSAKSKRLLASCDHGTLTGLTELVRPVHVNYEKEWLTGKQSFPGDHPTNLKDFFRFIDNIKDECFQNEITGFLWE